MRRGSMAPVYIDFRACVCMCVYVWVCMYGCVCLYVCMCVCLYYVCMCVYVCVCVSLRCLARIANAPHYVVICGQSGSTIFHITSSTARF